MVKIRDYFIMALCIQLLVYSAFPSAGGWWYANAEAGYHATRDKIYGAPKP